LRLGQTHPWLRPQRLPVQPPDHAHTVLTLRATPFAFIEFTVASGQCRTKTLARSIAVEQLGISEEALKDWRRQQKNLRPRDFEALLAHARACGAEMKRLRALWPGQKLSPVMPDLYANEFGLPALKRVAAALEALGADRGKKRKG